jgi:hypothetical protein
MLEFDASISGCKLPIGFGVAGVSVVLPCGDLVDQGLFVGDTTIETLFG